MLYITQENPPLRTGQFVTGIRVLIYDDQNMRNLVYQKVEMDDTLSISVTEDELPLGDDYYYLVTQAITNFGYTVITDPTLVKKKEDNDDVILTKLPMNFSPVVDVRYKKSFHPISLFYILGSTDDMKLVGCTYSYIIEHFEFGRYTVVFAEVDVHVNKVFVDITLKHTETYRVTVITRYPNRSTTTHRYNIYTAPISSLVIVPTIRGNKLVLSSDSETTSFMFLDTNGDPITTLDSGVNSFILAIYENDVLVSYEYFYTGDYDAVIRNGPPTIAISDGTVTIGPGSTVEVDVLANDEGTNLSIASIDSVGGNGNGTATIVNNKISYASSIIDADTTITINYTITGDGGTDTGTLTVIHTPISFDGVYKTENVGDTLNMSVTGDFYVDYGDGVVVGPTNVINQPSVGTGRVRIVSGNATVVKANDIFTDIHIEKCEFTAASSMFSGLTKLTNFTASNTAFHNSTSFTRTWNGCTGLTSFPVVNTSSATYLSSTWANCSSLTSFPLLDISNVTSLRHTWSDCNSLTSFPVIDTSSVTNLSGTWYRCSSLTSFPLIDTSNVTNLSDTWSNCTGLTSFPLIDTGSVAIFSYTWVTCTALTSFPSINTHRCTSFLYTWGNCSSLTSFPLIDTGSATAFTSTWLGCDSLTSFPAINTSTATTLSSVWRNCNSLTSFPAINTGNVNNISYAWKDCTSLTCIGAVNTLSATNTTDMFSNTPTLIHPTSGEQTQIASSTGMNYVNSNPCP